MNIPDQIDDAEHNFTIKVFKEMQETQGSETFLQDYKDSVDKYKKVVLVAVMGGKYSEGTDFPGDYARTVIICGIPYASPKDPYIKLKREYYDNQRDGLGRDWYDSQAFRRISQALGRGWRGREDKCMGILIDEKFTFLSNQSKFPKWIASQITVIKTWSQLVSHHQSFWGDTLSGSVIQKE